MSGSAGSVAAPKATHPAAERRSRSAAIATALINPRTTIVDVKRMIARTRAIGDALPGTFASPFPNFSVLPP